VVRPRSVEIVRPGKYCCHSKRFFCDSVLPRKRWPFLAIHSKRCPVSTLCHSAVAEQSPKSNLNWKLRYNRKLNIYCPKGCPFPWSLKKLVGILFFTMLRFYISNSTNRCLQWTLYTVVVVLPLRHWKDNYKNVPISKVKQSYEPTKFSNPSKKTTQLPKCALSTRNIIFSNFVKIWPINSFFVNMPNHRIV